MRRDGHSCTFTDINGARCLEPATDVDHVRPGDDHSDGNLTSLCGFHHRKKSSAEGARAAAANRRKQSRRFRRTEPHPGEL